jgi:protein involved in polysaccharide export with SLBB domain
MCQNNFIKGFFLIVCLFFGNQTLHAQDLLKGKDLSMVKVDQLSNAEIAKLKAQLTSAGMTPDQAEQIAISKGMPSAEAAKLKQRITSKAPGPNNNSGNPNNITERSNNSTEELDTYKESKEKTLINPLVFGSELYTGVSPSFEPNMKLATPLNYILGPDDQMLVSVYGIQEYSGDLLVSAEGSVSIPSVGQVKVAGLTIEAATQRLKNVMGNGAYSSLKSGGSKISVTLSKIRSIKVTIIGSNRPGNFNLSSLSTVFNALYIAGGPSSFGSFREIELIRNNKVERKIDLYRLLLNGDQSDNIGLKDNDVIRIPTYKTRVELQGQLKRPGIFEVLPGESFANILEFASGFTDTAYLASVKILQRSDKERKVQDLTSADYGTYHPRSGDVFVASKILERFQNRVRISGAVFRPDVYELSKGLTVADLIRKADGLKEDAYTGRGQIIRLQEDLTRSILAFNIKKALAGDQTDNQVLQREDEVLISSVLELRDSFKVTIQGEIRMPGQYEFVENLTLKDLILQAGGFTDAAYKNIEIARLLKRDSIASFDYRASTIIFAEINEKDLSSSSSAIALQPFDVVTIRRKAGYTLPESVFVSGQVQYPGPYALSSRSERVSDLIKRSGGFTSDAYPDEAYLKRFKTAEDKEKAGEAVKRLQKAVKDSTDVTATEILREYDKIPLDLNLIVKNPGAIEDIVLKSRDELVIPKFDALVKVSGEVLLATQVPFEKNNDFKDYVSAAGGFSAYALRKRSYVVYANGKAASIKHFLFFKSYPKIQPGSEIVVPKQPEKKSSSAGEVIGIASALASLAGVVIAILRL